MSQFTTPLIVEPIDARRWRLVEPFEYHIGSYPSSEVIRVPKGFVTDFASVPRIFWSILPPYNRYGKAAVLHDFCYYKGFCTRKRCDDLFLEAMEVWTVPKWKRLVMYWAVRLFGRRAWKRYRKMETRNNSKV